MNNPTVKAYGLINLTKKQYVVTQATVFAILLALFLATFFVDMDYIFLGNAKWTILIVTLLEGCEAYFMMKKFKEKAAV